MSEERKAGDGILVLCRIRPPNDRENGMPIITGVKGGGKTIDIASEEGEPHSFNFDAVMDMDCTQEQVYEAVGAPVLQDVLKGYNGTIFAYGQTGSGKTFTMQGPETEDFKMAGIIPRITHNLFNYLNQAPEYMEFLCRASLVEIYVEKIRDLFNPGKSDLRVREDRQRGIWIEGAEEFYVGSAQEALDLLKMGQSHRAVTATKMNMESSRSHSIFILTLVQKNNSDGSTKTSKLFLVDLAGSEKVRKTGAEGQTLEEAKTINKSLSALGNVINALTDGKSTHVPYRDSKLTRILQESLGGNSRTALVINCSPASDNEAETTSTCRFGARAKTVKNHAKMNLERSSAELKMLLARAEKEIERQRVIIAQLEEEIVVLRGGGTYTKESAVGKLLKEGGVAASLMMEGMAAATKEEKAKDEQRQKQKAEDGAKSDEEEEEDDEDDDEEDDIVRPLRTRTRSASIGFELELKALEAQNAKKEEELVLLQDENDTLRDQIDDKQAEIERLEEEMREEHDRNRDLEEDVKNMRVELEEIKYRFEEVAAELEAAQGQLKTEREQREEMMSQMKSSPDFSSQIVDLSSAEGGGGLAHSDGSVAAAGGGAGGVGGGGVERVRSPSRSAAEEAEKLVAAVEHGLSAEAAQDAANTSALDTSDVLSEDADYSSPDDADIVLPSIDMDGVRHSSDAEHLKTIIEQQVSKMNELATSRQQAISRRKQLEDECVGLKNRMLKDMTDYKKWKAAVLVDLRTRIDRNIRLEISLDETKERYESLLKNSHDPNKKRLHFLEQSVQSLTKKCQETQKQLEAFAAESKVNETKIQRKNARINILELLLNDARDRNEKLRSELHQVKGGEAPPMGPVDFVPPPMAPDEAEPEPTSAAKLPPPHHKQPPRLSSLPPSSSSSSPHIISNNKIGGGGGGGAHSTPTRVVKPFRGGGAQGEQPESSSISGWFKKFVKGN